MIQNNIVFNALPFPGLLLKPVKNDYLIADINENFRLIVSRTREDIIGKQFSEIFPDSQNFDVNRQRLIHSFKKVLNTGKPDKVEKIRYNISGREAEAPEARFFNIDSTLIVQNGEDMQYIFSVLQDVTQELTTHRQLNPTEPLQPYSDNKQNYFIDNHEDGLYCLDLDGNFTSFNQGLVDLAETTQEQLLKMNFFPFCAPHHLEEIKAHFHKATKGENQKFEADFISAKGKKLVLQVSLAPVYIQEEITGVYGIARDITLLKGYESALEKNEKKFKALIQEGSDLIAILDQEGIYKFVSDTSFPLLGIEAKELIGKSAFDFIHPEDREWVLESFSELKVKHQIEIKPFRFKNSKDQWRWIETTATNLCEDQNVEGIVVNSSDITEKIDSQKAVLESEERYRSFFEHSIDAILVTEPDGKILAANPSACRMFQRTEQEICKIGRSGIVDQNDPSMAEALKVRQKTGKVSLVHTYVRKDGTKFPGEVTSAIFRNSEGKKISSVIIRDISYKKKVEENLRRSRERYKFLFAHNPLPNWIFDNNTLEIIDVNKAAILHYGFSRKEFLSMKITDLRPDKEVLQVKRVFEKQQTNKRVVKYASVLHRKKDQTVIKVDVTGFRFDFDQRDCTLVVCQDITEREAILQRLKDREIKLQNAQEIARLGYWEYNLKDESLYWTKEVYNIWNRNPKEFSPSPEAFFESIHPEDFRDFQRELEISIAGKKELDAEHRIVLPNGEYKWVHEKGKLVKNEREKILRFEGTVQDITERKKSLQEIMLSEARQANILRSQTNYLIRTDLKGDYTYCNSKFLKDFQILFPNKSVLGQPALTTVKHYHHKRVKAIFERCINNPGEVFHVEIDKKKKDGEVKHTLWDFICLTDTDGVPVEFQCVGIDITDRVKAEKLLIETNRRYELVTKATSDAIWDWQCETGTLFWGEGFKSLFGYESRVLPPGSNVWEDNVHPEDALRVSLDLEKTLKSNVNVWQQEYRFKKADGDYAVIIDKAFIIRNKQHEAVRMVGAMQDITERKAFIQKLMLSESRFRSLVQSQTNYVIRVDMEGNYSYCNKKFRDDFGWIYEDNIILGKNTLGSIMGYHHDRVHEVSQQCVLHPNRVFQVEIDKPGKDSGIKSTLWDFIGITNSSGEPTEIQCVGIDISGRVIAERELKESNARYELVTKATSDAIWDWDLTNGKMFVGEGFQYLFGYKNSITTIDDWAEKVHSEDFFRVTNNIYAAIEGKTTKFSSTYRYKQANGEFAYVSDRALIVRDENNKAIRIVGAMQDVTEKKQLENLLEKATSMARIGSYELNTATKKIYWSPMTKEIHEVEENFIPEAEEAVLFYKKGSCRDKVESAFNNAVGRNLSFELEAIITTAKGNERWVRVMGDPEFEDGKCIKISGSIQDIDKIKRAEIEVLKAAEEKQVILESIGDAFFALNHDWEVTYWNQKAEDILNCPKDYILGRKLDDVFEIKNTPFEKFYKKPILENSSENFEAFYEATGRWFEINAYPSANGLSIYFRDVTERKNSNLRLLELNKELHKFTEELVTANEGLEQFSYIISHNLRAPVANIIGLADMLEEETYSEEIKNNLRKELLGSVKRLDKVIKDLNQILQVKNNISEIKKPVRLKELVSSIETSLQDIIRKEQVKITTNFYEVNEFTTVSTYLYSIFYNLIFNSIKFRQPGIQPVIHITSKRERNKIFFIFKDNGLGIDLEKKGKQLFKLYKRFHHHVEGKGMGLFMVKTQVEMLGGKINVSSAIDTGTTFTIEFEEGNSKKIMNGENTKLHSHR